MHDGPSARRRNLIIAAILAASASAAQAQGFMSQDFIAPGEESLTIGLGGIVNRFDTSVRFDGQSLRGSQINLEGNGASSSVSSFEGSLTWRFASRHRMDMLYYASDRSGTRTYSRDIEIDGTLYPLGATVGLKSKSGIFDVDYRYSFLKDPGFEMAALLGVYGGNFTFDVDAVGTSGGAQRTVHKSVSTTVPLPVLGVTFDWYPSRQWTLSGQLAGMKAKVGDVDGHIFLASANAEYMLVRNFGIGARYTYSDLNADVDKDDFNGNFAWRTNGVSLYGKFVF